MTMGLLHAFAVIFTLLLFVVRQRCALPRITSGKWRSFRQHVNQLHSPGDPAVQAHILECAQDFYLIDPKYKRDPEIDVDNEGIGFIPMG